MADNSEHCRTQSRRSCPVCGSDRSQTIFTHARLADIETTYASKKSAKNLMTRLDTNLCTVCGMLYRVPLMTEDELSQYYSQGYYETYNAGLKTQSEQPYSEQLQSWKKKYPRYFRFLARNKICLTGKRVLDVGCGRGYFLSAAREKGAGDCLGIEPSRQCYEKISSGKEYDFRVLNKCIRDVCPEETGLFDLVVCIGVLEHLSEPILDLEACRSLMKDDAHLYIYSHNEAPSLLMDIRKRISLVHQLYFTRRTVRALLATVGLQIVDLATRSTDMHILARKCQPVSPKCELSKGRYSLLKTRYLVCKEIPPVWFSAASWLHGKYLALRDRVVYWKIVSAVV